VEYFSAVALKLPFWIGGVASGLFSKPDDGVVDRVLQLRSVPGVTGSTTSVRRSGVHLSYPGGEFLCTPCSRCWVQAMQLSFASVRLCGILLSSFPRRSKIEQTRHPARNNTAASPT
jgi:hypothetical protein